MAKEADQNEEYMPVPSFYFRVGLVVNGKLETVGFQEVSGLEATLEVEEIIEGGNDYKLRLPVRISNKNLILSRGIISEEDNFFKWIHGILLGQNPINKTFGKKLSTVIIDLISPSNNMPIKSWQAVNAYPIRWSVSNFNSTENKIAVETVELTFQYLSTVENNTENKN